ncbi:class I SAM-dependent methyltransferase [Phycicoccus flavus]|uniref:Class I SAM-dependent methyltransferase n=1 Tax=Phycicoccus flavus TaxID=2502783 RepID=A0A8T6R5Y6_9MICO|nr:class I SAM-dependent methyltransferase [Phycicoccus flavus]NHA69276.1 class I SAM-dependent methyltransferase [Phycicoccus flavus]
MPAPDRLLADTFLLGDVAAAYAARPPYPDAVVTRLVEVAGGGRVLDLGAGEGSLARPLAVAGLEVDAVERAAVMVEAGRTAPGGDHPRLRWHTEPVEELSARGPFGLAVAGDAMHWFDHAVLVPRLARVLTPGAPLVLVTRTARHPGLDALRPVIARHSRSVDHDPTYDAGRALTAAGHWTEAGRHTTDPVPFRQSPAAHLEALRSTSSLARGLMDATENAAFDAAVLAVLEPLADDDGLLTLALDATLVTGHLRGDG